MERVGLTSEGGTGAGPTGRTERAGGRALWRSALLVGALAGGALGAGVAAFSAYAAYRLSRPRRYHGEVVVPSGVHEPVAFSATDGLQLKGWFLPGTEAGAALVLCHGFHTGRREMLPLAEALRERGHHVLLFDFRGHGESEGRWTSCGILETRDLAGAVRYLLARPEVKGKLAGAVGVSMGGSTAVLAAAGVPEIGAVVADSAFATMRGVVPYYFRAAFRLPAFPCAPLALRFGERLVGVKADQCRPVDLVGRLAPRPLLLIHGTADRIVPLREAFLLYESAGGPREIWTVAGANHVEARQIDPEGYVNRVEAFLRQHLAPTAGSAAP